MSCPSLVFTGYIGSLLGERDTTLLMSMLSETQRLCWIYTAARAGIHYLLNQNDCHRGTTFTLIGGDDEGQYMPLTEDKIKRLKEAAKESEVPEYEERKK